MEEIYQWVKSIVFYLILLTVVTNLLPGKKYEKYVRLFTGMLMVIIVIKPVTQVFSWDEIFDRNFEEMLKEGEQFSIDDTIGLDFENVQEEQLLEEYQRQIEAFSLAQAGSLGMNVVGFESEIEAQGDVLVPAAIHMEVTMQESALQSDSSQIHTSGEKDSKSGETGIEVIKIDQITVAEFIEMECAPSEKEQTRQLINILMQYYGLEESQIQITVIS